jgi:hypothetical protein
MARSCYTGSRRMELAALGNRYAPMTWRQQHEMDVLVENGASAAPNIVAFTDQRDGAYLVRELDEDQLLRVPFGRARPEPFPPQRGQAQRGALALRVSKYALIGAVLGGVAGVLLGILVALVAVIQLGRFGGRVRRWRRRWHTERRQERDILPAIASAERLRLLAAFGQGALAALLGAGVCLLLIPHILRYLPH